MEEKLVRLETRMKTNFFEIEKKLVSLEESSPDVLNERIRELEDLLLLLQLENIRIKEKFSSSDILQSAQEERLELPRALPSDVEERLNYIGE